MTNNEPIPVQAFKTSDGVLHEDQEAANLAQAKLNAEADLQEWLMMYITDAEEDWEEGCDQLQWIDRKGEGYSLQDTFNMIIKNRKSLLKVLTTLGNV